MGDVDALARTPALTIRRSRCGGHCGFIADYRLESWLDDYVACVRRGTVATPRMV